MAKLKTDIYVGIDGTGPEGFRTDIGVSPSGKKQRSNPGYGKEMQYVDMGAEESYAHQFVHSNVYHYWLNWHGLKKYYKRGPEFFGFSTEERARDAYDWLIEARKYSRGRIFLCGYSRGAYAVVRVAHMLKSLADKGDRELNSNVHALMLFDAVQRTEDYPNLVNAYFWGYGNKVDADQSMSIIPDNVVNCCHLRRSPKGKSREVMGNCSTMLQDSRKTSYQERFFHGTHGSMGGIYYQPGPGQRAEHQVVEPGTGATNVTFRQDKIAAHEARDEMDQFLYRVI